MYLSYREIAILFGVGVTLHDFEEAVYGPRWIREHRKPLFPPSDAIYWTLTSLVSAVVWIAVLGLCLEPRNHLFREMLTGFALAMAVNAVFPHLALSLAQRSYVPGTASGVLLNLPLGGILICDPMSAASSILPAWRSVVAFALFLGAGSLGTLYGAHALVARHRNRAC